MPWSPPRALQIPLTGALTLGWFGLPALGIRGPALAAVISFALAAVWMLSRLLGPEGRVAPALAGRAASSGRPSATS